MNDVLVVIPTYEEAANVVRTVHAVRAACPRADVLIVDDGSPDGTGDLADHLAASDPSVYVLHRSGKDGLGAAYRAGFGWGLERRFTVLVQMDADGSHRPEQLPSLLAALTPGVDVVLGSRWVPGGEVVDWPRRRELLSRGGNAFVRLLLVPAVRDATGGFRVFRRSALEAVDLGALRSQGYCFQVDMLLRLLAAGSAVVEVPITFVERAYGESKMSGRIVAEALWRVTAWGVRKRLTVSAVRPEAIRSPAATLGRRLLVPRR